MNSPFKSKKIDDWIRHYLTLAKDPFLDLYIVKRSILDPSKNTVLGTKLKQPIPLKSIHFSADYSNPEGIHKFLESLFESNLIRLEQEKNTLIWKFDFDEIGQLFVTDSVSELMAYQLGKLPADTKKALENAACLGFKFQLQDLSLVSDLPVGTAETAPWPAIYSGYIIPVNSNYKYIPGTKLKDGQSMEFKFEPRMVQLKET